MSIEVGVNFRLQGRQWTRSFTIPRGTTVLQLKEAMVRPRGTKEDAQAFSLLRNGEMLFDTEELRSDVRVDFKFVGRVDLARKRREVRLHKEATAAMPAEAEAEDTVSWVDVVVKHAEPQHESQITVRVPEYATALAVRQAVLKALGERRLSEVRLVVRRGSGLHALPDAEPIGTRRAFLSKGRKLDAPAVVERQEQKKPGEGEGKPVLTQAQALRLQAELLKGFEDPVFQQKLKALQGQPPKLRQALILSVQKEVLPKHGFEGSLKGVFQMLRTMDAFASSREFMEAGMRINKLLEEGGAQQTSAAEAANGRAADGGGARAASKSGSAAEKVPVYVEVARDTTIPLLVPRGTTIQSIKGMICAMDPTGKAKSETFRLSRESSPESPLEDAEEVADTLRLKILALEPPESETAANLDLEAPSAEPATDAPGTPRTESRTFDFDDLEALDPTPTEPEMARESTGTSETVARASDLDSAELEASQVAVQLRHATNGSSMTLKVRKDSTIRDLRKAAIEKLGQTQLYKLKIVRKQKGSFMSESDNVAITGRTEFFTLGCDLADPGA